MDKIFISNIYLNNHLLALYPKIVKPEKESKVIHENLKQTRSLYVVYLSFFWFYIKSKFLIQVGQT